MDIFHCSECDAYILRNIAENKRVECYCGEYMPKLSSEEVLNHLNKNRDKKHEESKKVYRLLKTNNTLQSDLDETQKALEYVMNVNDKLRAVLLEMAEAYCYGSTDVSFRLKAEKIIKELENE